MKFNLPRKNLSLSCKSEVQEKGSQPPHDKKKKHKKPGKWTKIRDFIKNQQNQDQPDEITYSFLHFAKKRAQRQKKGRTGEKKEEENYWKKTSPIKTFISNRVVMFHLKRKRSKIIMACIKLKAYQPREEAEVKIKKGRKNSAWLTVF